jgi:two-component system sensor histidine kinase NreB
VIEDNGQGFETDAPEAPGHGFGLIGMRERAALVGAALEIESSPGMGTAVFVRMTAEPTSERSSNHA